MMKLAGVAAMAAAIATTTHAQSDCGAHSSLNAFRSGVRDLCSPLCVTHARTRTAHTGSLGALTVSRPAACLQLGSYCASDYARCSDGCRSFLTRQFGRCPSLAAGLSDADMTFIVTTCGIERPQVSKGDGPAAGSGAGFYSLSAIDIEGNTVDFAQ
eukprot:COSAG03_NODE_2918_length_2357_cov_7.547830_1_plen_157_part_00